MNIAASSPIVVHSPGSATPKPTALAAKTPPAASPTWSLPAVEGLFELPFTDLLYRAQQVHRENFDPNAVQLSTLLSIKTGGCSEDCAYCSQSSHYNTNLKAGKLLEVQEVIEAARRAKEMGAGRFCMGAAWRSPHDRHLPALTQMVREVKALGLETCMTLGMLEPTQAQALSDAGLDYYNHNLDTDPGFYGNVITTRVYQDRLDTLRNVRNAGIKICCGGILGMGESRHHRAGLIAQLANLEPYPESVPINQLVPIEGTPLAKTPPIDPIEFIRTIAVARITMPRAVIRLSAGRNQMGDAAQALAFVAGANSIFYGDQLLTTDNSETSKDSDLLRRLGMKAGAVAPKA
ncbi:MAG TPA: biotin synthase BioB [Burkholderiaceae bacterium]|nr:biotin synthase BioB [Burkholderiaceae bacterium]